MSDTFNYLRQCLENTDYDAALDDSIAEILEDGYEISGSFQPRQVLMITPQCTVWLREATASCMGAPENFLGQNHVLLLGAAHSRWYIADFVDENRDLFKAVFAGMSVCHDRRGYVITELNESGRNALDEIIHRLKWQVEYYQPTKGRGDLSFTVI